MRHDFAGNRANQRVGECQDDHFRTRKGSVLLDSFDSRLGETGAAGLAHFDSPKFVTGVPDLAGDAKAHLSARTENGD
nr:hypothetical protein [Marinicella sp. W31]MDC2875573.1 hypothetical protein [Marinicella sp. W31]